MRTSLSGTSPCFSRTIREAKSGPPAKLADAQPFTAELLDIGYVFRREQRVVRLAAEVRDIGEIPTGRVGLQQRRHARESHLQFTGEHCLADHPTADDE